LEKRVGAAPKYKPGDMVVTIRNNPAHITLPKSGTCTLETRKLDGFYWQDGDETGWLRDNEIECLAPEPKQKAGVWHEWSGGECPVPKGGWCIAIRRKGTSTFFFTVGDQDNWKHWKGADERNRSLDIIKYMIIDPPPEHREGK